jgi:fibronectin-binding autotransporter adhesin
MRLTWWHQLAHAKSLFPRRHGTAARRKPFYRPQLELLEGRITPAVHTWFGIAGNPLWSDSNNWTGGAPGGDSNAQLVFGFFSNFAGGINNYSGLFVQSIEFSNPGFAPSGNALTIRGDVTNNAGTNALNMPVTFNNGIDNTAPQFITVGNGSFLIMNGVISSVNAAESLHKAGAGQLIFGARNTYFIPTVIDAGTLTTSEDQAVPAASRVFVSPGATFDLGSRIDQIASLTGSGGSVTLGTGCLFTGHTNESTIFSGVISGVNGDLFKEGTGTFVLGGLNTYGGGTHINAGRLSAGVNNAVPAGSRVTVDPGAWLDVINVRDTIGSLEGWGNVFARFGFLTTGGNNRSTNFAGVMSGTGGSLAKEGTGQMFLSAQNTYTGATQVNGGALTVAVDNAIPPGPCTVAQGATLVLDDHNVTLGSLSGLGTVSNYVFGLLETLTVGADNTSTTFSGVITDGLNLTKIGSGTFILGGNNTYTGETAVNAGTLAAGVDNAWPPNPLRVALGATLDLNGFRATVGSLAGAGTVSFPPNPVRTLTTGMDNTATTFSGVIRGSGNLTKVGTGTFTLTAASTYTGETAILAGTLAAGVDNAWPPGPIRVALGATLDMNGFNATVGSLAGAGTVSLPQGPIRTLTTGMDNTSTTFSGVIRGPVNLSKQGLGEQTLNGDNTYTGPTTVIGGTLVLNGSQPSRAVMVQGNGTLGGTGTVGAVTVFQGGTVRPGTSAPGHLASASVSFFGTTSLRIRLNGITRDAGYDQLNVTGAVGLVGAMLVASLDSPSYVGDTFTILSSGGGISGIFNGHPDGDVFPIDGAHFRINYTANSVVLTHIAPPANHFLVSAPGSSAAGAPFDVTLRALDPYNYVDATYTGTVTFTSSDGTAALPRDYTFESADNGVHTFAGGVTLFLVGNQTVTTTDTVSGITGGAGILITPAAADHFGISAPAQALSGTPLDVTITAQDPYGNTDTNYQGTVTFTTSDTDPGVVLPASYTFTAGDAGVHTFTDTGLGETTLITPGDQTLTATDTAGGIMGSATVTVTLAPAPPGGHGNSQVGLGVRNQAPLVPTVVFAPAEASLPLTAGRESVSPSGADATPRALDAWAVDRLFAMEPEGRGLAISGWRHATRQGIHDSSAHGLLQDPWLADGVFP